MSTPNSKGASPKKQGKSSDDALSDTIVPGSERDLEETSVPPSAEPDKKKSDFVGDVTAAQREASKKAKQAAKKAGAPAKKVKKVSQLGDFKLLKKLGQGGMGTVYLARQVSLDREVALKTLSQEFAKKEDFVKRFIREARSMAKLQHPNVVQVYAADSMQGVHYAAIEFIDGQSMQDWMDDRKRLSVGDALYVTLVCADALKHAHDQNMIHRDIKPDNILVTKKGVVKVADFGLAKALDEDVSMTQSGTGLGTPIYMAPEQARNAKHVDKRSDIYALGSTLYYFLTGKLPFAGDNTLELIMAKEKGTFTSARKLNPEVTERLDLMIDKMMAKTPEHRYSDCGEIIHDLQSLGLDSPSLSFIEGVETIRVNRPVASGATSKPAVKRAGPAISSAADADRSTMAEMNLTEQWIVQYRDAAGKPAINKMTTKQIVAGLKGGTLDVKTTKLKKRPNDSYALAALFPEFEGAVKQQSVKTQAESKSRDVKNIYSKLDKQDRRRKRWRWLKRLIGGVKGFIGLIAYLVIVAAALWAGWTYGWPFVRELIKGSG